MGSSGQVGGRKHVIMCLPIKCIWGMKPSITRDLGCGGSVFLCFDLSLENCRYGMVPKN